MAPKLAPSQPLSGFADMLPAQARAFHDAANRITRVYERYGYGPIDTPCIFLYETLAGEQGGEIDKQLYRWSQGSKDVALRFDLTVPLARYLAANETQLQFPFKRYHLGKVWRGESVQQKRGRYREFYQLDFDTVGTDSPSADLECLLIINDSLRALGIEKFTIRLNDRALLNGVLASMNLSDRSTELLRIIDKLDKVGEAGVEAELRERLGLDESSLAQVMDYTRLGAQSDAEAILSSLESRYGANELVQLGLGRVRFLLSGAEKVIGPGRVKLDPSIARGLGYYTGPVFETILDDLPDVGSVCSGGRYDDLASSYMKRRLPGVGASVGLSRLLAALESLKIGDLRQKGPDIVILPLPGVDLSEGALLQRKLHERGLEAELYPQSVPGESGVKPKNLFAYAAARGFAIGLILGTSEVEQQAVTVKDLIGRQQRDALPLAEAFAWIEQLRAAAKEA